MHADRQACGKGALASLAKIVGDTNNKKIEMITARALRFIQTPSNSFENDLTNKMG
jgi:hypothetical protein